VHLSLDDVVKKKGEAEKKDEAAASPTSGIPGLPNLPLGGVPAGQQ
jgi:hypothetical protein